MSDDLTLLVGSNSLPNYVATAILRPQRVHLIHSEDTKVVCQRLADCLRKHFGCEAVNPGNYRIGNATSVQEIRRVAERLPTGCALNYTGGTKVMAAHVLDVWKQKRGGCDARASYLDDKSDKLLFDDETEIPIKQKVQIALSTLTDELHGLEVKTRTPIAGGPTDQDATIVAKAVCGKVSLADQLYQQSHKETDRGLKWKTAREAREQPIPLASIGADLSAAEIPCEGSTSAQIEAWLRFLGGDWLEDYVALLLDGSLSNVADADDDQSKWSIHKGVTDNSKKDFEVDVVLLRGHRLYAVSCTTEAQNYHLCQSKLFEVALRARQLGGDLARFAFICLLDRDSNGNDWAGVLEDKIGSSWESHCKPRVFGLRHLREWIGTSGTDGNLTSLQQWLSQ